MIPENLQKYFEIFMLVVGGLNFLGFVALAIVQYRAKANPEKTWEDDLLPTLQWAVSRLWYVSEQYGVSSGKKGADKLGKMFELVKTFREMFKQDPAAAVAWAESEGLSAEHKLIGKEAKPLDPPQAPGTGPLQ